jgi:hypothetical protein
MLSWDRIRGVFVPDGSLHDIVVQHTDLAVWQRFLNEVQGWFPPPEYRVDGEPAALPLQVAEIFEIRKRASPSLTFRPGGIAIISHFFVHEEIDLDYSPEEITTAAKWQALHSFTCALARLLARPLLVAPEGAHELPMFRYHAGRDCLDRLEPR